MQLNNQNSGYSVYRNPGMMNIKQNGNSHIPTLGIQPNSHQHMQQMIPGPSPKYQINPSPSSSTQCQPPMMVNRQFPDYNNQKVMHPPMANGHSPMSAMSPNNNMYGRTMAPPMVYNNMRGPDNFPISTQPSHVRNRSNGQLFSPPVMNLSTDQCRLSADSPASQASGDSNPGKRKRPDDDDVKEGTTSKKPKNNASGTSYNNVIDFIKRTFLKNN